VYMGKTGASTNGQVGYEPNSDYLYFFTVNTEKMRITSSGNVGVGTTSPIALINAHTTQGGSTIAATHGTGGSYPKASGISMGATSTSYSPSNNGGTVQFVGGCGIYANNTAASGNPTDMVFWVNSGGTPAEAVRITNSGNVGIGTTSPAVQLHIKGANDSQLRIDAGSTNDAYLSFAENGVYQWYFKSENIAAGNELSIYNAAGLPKFLIQQGGNVGIGTSSPSDFGGVNLQVQNSNISSILWSNGTYIGQLLASAGAEVSIGSRSNHPLRIGTNDTERMRIDSSGRLLINTTTSYYASGFLQLQSGKFIVRSTDNSYGQVQIGNSDSDGEASQAFVCGVSTFGNPTSVNGDSRVWIIGANIYGIGGNQFGIGNKSIVNFTAKLASPTATAWTFSSDERLKDIEGEITNATSIIEAINPIYFSFKSDPLKKRKVGVTAQNVLTVLPEVIDVPASSNDSDGDSKYLGIGMSDIVPVLIAALKESNQRIETLEAEVASLKPA